MKLILGNCLHKLKELEDNSVDSIVTDPPYGLSFMGKHWDYDVPQQEIWEECLRVLKPGGHLLSFAGSRTYHRMAVRIEDAGFEIRDQIMWIYGSGFPKSHNIGKAIDKKGGIIGQSIIDLKKQLIEFANNCGKTRSEIDKECGFRATNYLTLPSQNKKNDPWVSILPTGDKWKTMKMILGIGDEFDEIFKSAEREIIGTKKIIPGVAFSSTGPSEMNITLPATEEAKQWEGWGTALKPAHEPIVMARKPLSENTVVDNVLKHGTGGINIDESRIGNEERTYSGMSKNKPEGAGTFRDDNWIPKDVNVTVNGRFPANIILDEEAGKLLDEQSGISKGEIHNKPASGIFGGNKDGGSRSNSIKDEGGVSRFFYCPKASKTDRNEGLEEFEDKEAPKRDDGQPYGMNTNKFRPDGSVRNEVQPKKNNHPTVKPTDLMLYLIRLVTPKGGTTLDPFMGSGSSGKAAVRGGFDFIGIEMEKEYMEIASARIQYEIDNPLIESGERISKETVDTASKFFDI